MSSARFTFLSRLFSPGGRAFRMPGDSVHEKLEQAVAASLARAHVDALSIQDSTIADNPNFTAADATDWERRLGIASAGSALSLAVRRQAINQKISYPNTAAPRQHHSFIEKQLRDAGFDVRIYENNFAGVAKSPEQVLGTTAGASFHATTVRHKSSQRHGTLFNHTVVNSLERATDALFSVGSNFRSTFFISGTTLTTFADVPVVREMEFRQLILQLKPVQTVAYLFVNYV